MVADVEELLRRFVEGTLGAEEARLYDAHCGYFCHRVRSLDPSFFPGSEKSTEAARSLANGAYASFAKEPEHFGQPAFVYAVSKAFRPPSGFLYYWRDSAAIRFLRKEGSELLRARANLQRNVRIHLRQGFRMIARRLGQTTWAPHEWSQPNELISRAELDRLHLSIDGRDTKALVRAVLEEAKTPLTASEITSVIERALGYAREVPLHGEHAEGAIAPEETVFTSALQRRLQQFWETVDREERELLIARGYAEGGVAKVSFRVVAEKLGRLGGESYRNKEREIFERLRAAFSEDEMDLVAKWLVDQLATVVTHA